MVHLAAAMALIAGLLASSLASARPSSAQRQPPARTPATAAPSTPPARGAPRTPTAALLSADASLVAAQSGRTIRIWRRERGELVARVDAAPMFRGDVAPAALIAVRQGGITVWRGAGFKQQVTLRLPRKLLSIARAVLSADGRVAAALYAGDGGVGDPDSVGVWDATSGKLRTEIKPDAGRVLGATLSADGALLALYGDARRERALLYLYRLEGREARRQLAWSSAADRTTYCAAFAPGGGRLALCAGQRLVLFDVKRRRPVAATPTSQIKRLFPAALRGPAVRLPGAHMVAFSPDGSELLTAHAFGVVGLARWSVAPLAPRAWLKRPTTSGTMRAIAWDAGGAPWLLTASYGPQVWIHAPRRGRFSPVRTLGR